MNKPLISAGVTLSALSLIAVAPAQAGTLTFNFEAFTSEEASLKITFGSFLQGTSLGSIAVPESLQVTAKDVTGSFTVLDDPAQFTNGSIDLNSSLLNDVVLSSTYSAMLESLLGDYGLISSQVVQSADNLFAISEFSGSGVLESKDFTLPSNPSSFNIGYNNSTNSVVIDGYSPEVVESCLSTTCLLDGNVSFGVNLVLSEFVTLTSDLLANSSVSLTQEVSTAIAGLQQMATIAQFAFGPTLNLATVEIEAFSATTNFVSADPTGTDLDAEITDGSITATTDAEAKEIFSQPLASASVPVKPPVVNTKLPTIIEAEPPAETVVELPVEKTPPMVIEKPDIVTEAHSAVVETPSLLNEVPSVVATSPLVTNTPTSTPGGSITITTEPIRLVSTPLDTSDDTQDVPEPSILVGVLGAAVLSKRGLKKTNAQ